MRALPLLLTVLFTVSLVPALAAQDAPDRLPIFRLAEPELSDDALTQAAELIGVRGRVTRTEDGLAIRSRDAVAELDAASGALWAADYSQLWNPDLTPDLISEGRAEEEALEALNELGLLEADGPFVVQPLGTTQTHAAFFDASTNRRSDRKLDVRATYGFAVEVEGMEQPVPVLGGDYSVTFGNGGRPIAVEGAWRRVEGIQEESRTIPARDAISRFLSQNREFKVDRPRARLVYVSQPPGEAQQALYPAWALSGRAEIGGEEVDLREVLLPATAFGPELPRPLRIDRRDPDMGPPRRSTVPEEAEGQGPRPPLAPEAWRLDEPFARGAEGYKEAAAEWIGPLGNLPRSQANATGFVDGLRRPFDAINFNFGDNNVWETDWTTRDDQWIDAADFVFYTGHASGSGWQVTAPNDTWARFSDINAAGDRLGAQDLEWLVIAACGPLQDSRVAGSGNVFQRWRGLFQGLHLFMGYAAVTYDNDDEGRLLAKYTRRGQKIVDAWFRTAREVQPAENATGKIYVGVVYGYEPGKGSPRNDHLHGEGRVAPDSKNPTRFVGIYTGT